MGYADGYYYGQGRIICDTSTFSVGDTIRVRSVYNALQTEDKQVVTVGTPLIFTVPPYDYYKVCKVVTISDVETEVGGEFVTIDYGQTHRSTVLDKESFSGVKAILNAGKENEILSIGDTVRTKYNGADWEMEVCAMDLEGGRNVALVSKQTTGVRSWDLSGLKTECTNFYNGLEANDKALVSEFIRQVCTDARNGTAVVYSTFNAYAWLPTRTEVDNVKVYVTSARTHSDTQFPLFTTQANRVRHDSSNNATNWWTYDQYGWVAGSVQQTQAWAITDVGATTQINITNRFGICPCVLISADS